MKKALNWGFLLFSVIVSFLLIDHIIGSYQDFATIKSSSGMFRMEASQILLRSKLLRAYVDHKYPLPGKSSREFRSGSYGTVLGPDNRELLESNNILFLGGSTTETNEVSEELRFPYLAGKLLTKGTDQTYVGVNLGVRGNTTRDSLNLLVNHPVVERSDYIVVMHNINDRIVLARGQSYNFILPKLDQSSPGDIIEALFYLRDQVIEWLTYKSNIIFAIRTRVFDFNPWVGSKNPSGVVDERSIHTNDVLHDQNIEKFKNNLRLLGATSVILNKPIVFMTQPLGIKSESQSRYNDAIRSVSQEKNFELIDLDKAFPDDRNWLFLGDKIHLNNDGSILIANLVTKHFKEFLNKSKSGQHLENVLLNPLSLGDCTGVERDGEHFSIEQPKVLIPYPGRYPVSSSKSGMLYFQTYVNGREKIRAYDSTNGSITSVTDPNSDSSERHAVPLEKTEDAWIIFGQTEGNIERLVEMNLRTGVMRRVRIPDNLSSSIPTEDNEGNIIFAATLVDHKGLALGPPDLYRFVRDTGETERLTNTNWEEWRPAVDPLTGDIYHIANPNKQFDIFRLDAETGVTSVVYASSADEWDPAISPDGKWLSFASKKSGNFDVYLMKINGTNQLVRLTIGEVDEWDPRFSPDSTMLMFAGSLAADPPRIFYVCLHEEYVQ